MFIMNEITGDMTVRQGDTYTFKVEGITDDWNVYYSVYRASDREILFEINTNPVNGVCTFNVDSAKSNLLTVPNDKKTEIYYYGIKRCKEGIEDTVIIGDKEVSSLNKILVYPLTTEGDENGAS